MDHSQVISSVNFNPNQGIKNSSNYNILPNTSNVNSYENYGLGKNLNDLNNFQGGISTSKMVQSNIQGSFQQSNYGGKAPQNLPTSQGIQGSNVYGSQFTPQGFNNYGNFTDMKSSQYGNMNSMQSQMQNLDIRNFSQVGSQFGNPSQSMMNNNNKGNNQFGGYPTNFPNQSDIYNNYNNKKN